MDVMRELYELREMNRAMEAKIQRLVSIIEGSGMAGTGQSGHPREMVYPLTEQTKIFKGKKPLAVIFPNGRRVDVLTWKQLAEVILRDCNADPVRHNQLLDLRGRIGGRNRVLLAADEEGMRSPRAIDRELYFETHYDVENLLRLLVTRILYLVDYDYRGISIVVLNKG